MPEKEVIIKDTKLKYSGVFDTDRVYRKLLEWFENNEYGAAPNVEKSYLERISPGGKTIEVVLEGKKKEEGYFRFELGVKIFGKRIQDTETVIDGNKVKMHKGDVDLQFSSALVWNVSDDDKDVFPEASLMKRFYDTFLMRDKLEDAKIELYKETMGFIEEMKQFLNLYQL